MLQSRKGLSCKLTAGGTQNELKPKCSIRSAVAEDRPWDAVYRASVLEVRDLSRRSISMVGRLRFKRVPFLRSFVRLLGRARRRIAVDSRPVCLLGQPIRSPDDARCCPILGGPQRVLLHWRRGRATACMVGIIGTSSHARRRPISVASQLEVGGLATRSRRTVDRHSTPALSVRQRTSRSESLMTAQGGSATRTAASHPATPPPTPSHAPPRSAPARPGCSPLRGNSRCAPAHASSPRRRAAP